MTTQIRTYAERLMALAVAANSPTIPLDNTCDVVVVSGNSRLASRTVEGLINLATTALNGASQKEILSSGSGAPATITLTGTKRCCALIVRIAGARNVFRRAPISLAIDSTTAGDNITAATVVVFPKEDTCGIFHILTTENGNNGQVTVTATPRVVWTSVASFAANEFFLSTETINVRDFTVRELIGTAG